jgi:hypothetical protein
MSTRQPGFAFSRYYAFRYDNLGGQLVHRQSSQLRMLNVTQDRMFRSTRDKAGGTKAPGTR